jgi:hypothetical protein
MCGSIGYEYCDFFGGLDHHKMFAADGFGALNTRPEGPTLIHLCGKARMGQVVPKQHIGLVYESSESPKTDTILQALPGRMCGYDTNGQFTGDIYLSKSTQKEVTDYIKSWDNPDGNPDDSLMCHKAMNLSLRENVKSDKIFILDKDGGVWEKLVPMKIFNKDFELDHGARRPTIQEINVHMLDNLLETKPDKFNGQQEKVRDCLLRSRDNRKGESGMHSLNLDERIAIANSVRETFDIAHSNGRRETWNRTNFVSDHTTTEVNPLIMATSSKDPESFYLIGAFKTDNLPSVLNIPKVSQKCVHAQRVVPVTATATATGGAKQKTHKTARATGGAKRKTHKTARATVPNGCQAINMPAETSTDPEMFKRKLWECVDRTIRDNTGYIKDSSKSIDGCVVNGKKRYIYLKKSAVPTNFKESIKMEFAAQGISIQFKSKKGPKCPLAGEYHIFSSITW